MAFDGLHGCSVGGDITIVVKAIATAGNLGAIDLVFFRADVNGVAGIGNFLVMGDAGTVDPLKDTNAFNIFGWKSLEETAKFVFTGDLPADAGLLVVVVHEVLAVCKFVEFIVPNQTCCKRMGGKAAWVLK